MVLLFVNLRNEKCPPRARIFGYKNPGNTWRELLLFLLSQVFLWLIFIPLWLIFGFILGQMKLFSVGKVWESWKAIWSGDEFQASLPINIQNLNWSLLIHTFGETFPHLIIQSYNNYMMGLSSSLDILSIITSVIMIFNEFYRLAFYMVLQGRLWPYILATIIHWVPVVTVYSIILPYFSMIFIGFLRYCYRYYG